LDAHHVEKPVDVAGFDVDGQAPQERPPNDDKDLERPVDLAGFDVDGQDPHERPLND